VYTADHESVFRSFLGQNQAFWRENTPQPIENDGRLYVDLSHDHPGYLLTNLWLAKYVQRFRGGRLIGLAHGWIRACPHYSYDRLRQLAESFLVDEVVDLDKDAADDSAEISRFEADLRGRSGEQLRRAIFAFDGDCDPDLGWILYDTWLRQERCATIETASHALFQCARSVLRVRRIVSETMRNGITLAAVVGHYHYSPYSFIALEALRQSAPVYFQSLLIPVSIRRFQRVEELRRGRPADFNALYGQHIVASTKPDRLANFEARLFDIQQGTREFFGQVASCRSDFARREFLTAYELDPDLPVACFYVPALCGAPYCFGPIPFDDLGDWLRRSLQIALRLTGVNFLVKRHPQDAIFDTTNLVGQLENLCGAAPNIRFLRGDTPSDTLAGICDVVVTVNGTPGYDMAVRGVPTIAAGPSRYSALGFALEPSNMQEYEELLRTTGKYKLSGEQRRRALLFAYFELAAGRSVSLFLPQIRTAGTAAFWEEAERHLRSRFIEEDPLWRNVRQMLAQNLPFLLNTDLIA
jgi:hypothetical protein